MSRMDSGKPTWPTMDPSATPALNSSGVVPTPLGTQHSLAIGGEVVDAARFDMGDFLASGAEGDDEVVQHESGVDTDTDSRDAVLFGEFVEFLSHVGVLGLGAGHLFGDAHDVDASGDDGAQIGDLVADPRGCGDGDDVDLVGIEDGGGIGCDVGSERICLLYTSPSPRD